MFHNTSNKVIGQPTKQQSFTMMFPPSLPIPYVLGILPLENKVIGICNWEIIRYESRLFVIRGPYASLLILSNWTEKT